MKRRLFRYLLLGLIGPGEMNVLWADTVFQISPETKVDTVTLGIGYAPGGGPSSHFGESIDTLADTVTLAIPYPGGGGASIHIATSAETLVNTVAVTVPNFALGMAVSSDGDVDTRLPTLDNIAIERDPSSGLYHINFDLGGSDFIPSNVTLRLSSDGGVTWNIPAISVSNHIGANVALGTGRSIVWNASADLRTQPNATNLMAEIQVTADEATLARSSSIIPIERRPLRQIVKLCFGFPSPWSRALPGAERTYQDDPAAPANLTPQEQAEVLTRLAGMFARAGISPQQLSISIGPPEGKAVNVFFTEEAAKTGGHPGLSRTPGLSGPDRFNTIPAGSVLVYYSANPAQTIAHHPNLLAETVANELGLCFGLFHINPGVTCQASLMDLERCDGSPEEAEYSINFYAPASPRWDFGVTPSRLFSTALDTHSELFHLRKWINGDAESVLAEQGVFPGTYDTEHMSDLLPGLPGVGVTSLVQATVPLGTVLYNVKIYPQNGLDSQDPLAEFESLSAAQLAEWTLHLDEFFPFSIVASSTAGGSQEIRAIIPSLPANDSRRMIIPAEGVTSIAFEKVLSGGGTEILGSGTATASPKLLPVKEAALCLCGNQQQHVNITWPSTPGLTYSLERSIDLQTWDPVPAVQHSEAVETKFSFTDPDAAQRNLKLYYRITSHLPTQTH